MSSSLTTRLRPSGDSQNCSFPKGSMLFLFCIMSITKQRLDEGHFLLVPTVKKANPLSSPITLVENLYNVSSPSINMPNTENTENTEGEIEVTPVAQKTKHEEKERKQIDVKIKYIRPYALQLLHQGKDGGGTIRGHGKKMWKIGIRQCHPYPCPETFATQQKYIRILTLRDPIDRFVSAFYYRAKLIENNQRCYNGRKTHACNDRKSNYERHVLHDVYDRNISKMAIGLCSVNETVQNQTFYHKATLGSLLRSDLKDWLVPGWKNYHDRIFPIVLEAGFDFVNEINTAIEWAYSMTHFEAEEMFAKRRERVFQSIERMAQNARLHSSGKERSIALNSLAYSCLRKYYEKSYQQMKEVRDICKSEYCANAIESILKRRGVT